MPAGSTIRDFITALDDRKSEIAKKLDACSQDPTCRATILPAIQAWDTSTTVPDVVVNALGLTPKEVEHIDDWDAGQKDQIRNKAVIAITSDPQRAMEFWWELHDGANAQSDTHIDDPGGTAKITVTFLSPRKNVRKSPVTFGEVYVDI